MLNAHKITVSIGLWNHVYNSPCSAPNLEMPAGRSTLVSQPHKTRSEFRVHAAAFPQANRLKAELQTHPCLAPSSFAATNLTYI